MKYYPSDNLLILLTCIGLYISYHTIHTTLQATKDAAESPSPLPTHTASGPTRHLESDAEDKIDLSALRTLSKSHNFEVRNAAVKILLERALKPGSEARERLLRDVSSKQRERRGRGIQALELLIRGVDVHDGEGNRKRLRLFQFDKEVYQALVQALVNLLPEHERLFREQGRGKEKQSEIGMGQWRRPKFEVLPSPIRPIARPQHEESVLRLLTLLMNIAQDAVDEKGERFDAMAVALDAGLVGRWLANYPFPCALPKCSGKGNFKKSDVVSLFEYNNYAADDHLMHGMITLLSRSPRGMKELRKAGLTTSIFKEDVQPVRRAGSWGLNDGDEDVLMLGGEETAGLRRAWTTIDAMTTNTVGGARPRSSDRSREEDRLRRRHREAIVVAERGEPLNQGNILQRQDSEAAMTPVVFLDDDDVEERESNMSISDDGSIPSLGEVLQDPVDRRSNESPQSFRRRVSERLRQEFTSFPTTEQVRSSTENAIPPSPANGHDNFNQLSSVDWNEVQADDVNPADVPD